MLRKLLLVTALVAPSAFASHQSRHFSSPTPRAVPGSLVELALLDRQSGEQLPVYAKEGVFHVAGEPGRAYSLVARNRTAETLMVVLSVDGVNVVTGETASTKQQGYVLPPYTRTEVSGWRKSMNEVAQFYFTPVADSYAARTDRPANTGVIGAAVFRSATRLQPRVMEMNSFNRAAAAPSARAATQELAASDSAGMAAPQEKLGTGHGKRETSRVEYADFSPEAAAAEILAVRYDSRVNLIAQGVIPRPAVRPVQPNPFPSDTFVPDPKR